tara:strand:- start:583 stop:729 length:147 start_codon:yes stop_codon:yes gene_type:complete
MSEYEAGLDHGLKTFIIFSTIIGPLAIAGVIFILKKIEKNDPQKIRWK